MKNNSVYGILKNSDRITYGYSLYNGIVKSSGSGPFEYTAIDNNFSMEFDGTGDSVDAGDFSLYDNGDFSASLWINTSSTRSTTDYVLSNSGSGSKAGIDIIIDRFGNVKAARNTRTSDTNSGFQSVGLTLNTWHHIAFTYTDATRTLIVYFDGSPVNTSVGSASANSASNTLTIGSYLNTSSFYLGNIDEVALWNTALSEGTIQAIYNTTNDNPGKVADLSETPEGAPVAWYRFE